jgi:glycosyltransferase involved in cell wall biosynthesis
MKKICICITNYRKEKFLDRAIRSCLAQIPYELTIEIILVNDGSAIFKKKIIQREFPSIKILSYKNNKGVSFASNMALKKTNADYFIRVDADDYISMKACILLSSILDDNKIVPFVYGDILLIKKNSSYKTLKRNNRNILLNNGAGILFRTKYLKKIGGYNKDLRNCEDFDLIIRLEKKYGKGYYIPVAYYRYYITNSQHLSKERNRSKIYNSLKIKYEKYL